MKNIQKHLVNVVFLTVSLSMRLCGDGKDIGSLLQGLSNFQSVARRGDDFFSINAETLANLLKIQSELEKGGTSGTQGSPAKEAHDALRTAVDNMIKKLSSRLQNYSEASSFIAQIVAREKIDNIRNVNFSNPQEIVSGIGQGIAIRAASSIGNKIGDEVDDAMGSFLRPFFSKLKESFTKLYRTVFKQGKAPFDAVEIYYWRDCVVNSLNFLLESSKEISEHTDRDRQQRHRDLLRKSTVASLDKSGQQTESSGEFTDPTSPADYFAREMIRECVEQPLKSISFCLTDRCKYYHVRTRTFGLEGQIVDLAKSINKSLLILINELKRCTTVKELASPEFRAILPSYTDLITKRFDNLAHLVKAPDASYEGSSAQTRGSLSTHRFNKRVNTLGGLGYSSSLVDPN